MERSLIWKITSTLTAKQMILVTGPARSGKSEWAENLATNSGKSVIYIATAHIDPNDAEWQARIAEHQRRRPTDWVVQHVPIDLAASLQQLPPNSCCLVDSLGTWLANLLDRDDDTWQQIERELLTSLAATPGEIIFVAEEVGWGVVPAYPLGRTFRDRLGRLVRRLGAIAAPVYLVTGGYVLNLTTLGSPLPSEIRNAAAEGEFQ